MIKRHLAKLLFCLPFMAACQNVTPRLVCVLPDKLRESSGLIVESNNLFWTMNDSGGEPELYQFDSTGVIKHTVRIKNASNIDWEEIGRDTAGNFYIGEFGNNANDRNNLKIYKIPRDSIQNRRTDTISATEIKFRYADQTEFPPPAARLFYDAEAMLIFPDSAFVFTKDFQTDPYVGSTHIYGMRNDASISKQTIQRLDSIKTDNSWKYNGAITAAAMSPDGLKVVLMSYQKLFIFTDFPGKYFWKGRRRELTFGLDNFAQREAAAFLDSCTLYMTSEKNTVAGVTVGGNLSKINLCQLLTQTKDISTAAAKPQMHIAPNPSVSSDISISFDSAFSTQNVLKIFTANGSTVFEQPIPVGESAVVLENKRFPTAGFYFCKLVSSDNIPLSIGKIVIVK